MKVLFVCLHAPMQAPSQRFRFEQYFDFLTGNGIDCTYSNVLEDKDYKYFYKKGFFFRKLQIVVRSFIKRLNELKSAGTYDIVFIQREAIMLGTSYFEKRYAKKAKTIFDYDDAVWLQQISGTNKLFKFLKNPDKTNEIIAFADLVFAGNKYLADHARKYNEQVIIVPTTIDTDLYIPAYKPGKEKICIGWSGSFSTIQHFETCLDALKIIKKKYGDNIYFKVIGDEKYINKDLGVQGFPWKKETEVRDLQEIDIGIMPLPDDEWAKGKCGLKGLQYMALSIPTIMSPVGVNSEIIQNGHNGFLASSTDEWVEMLSELIDSSKLREKMGTNGRETVVTSYSIDAVKNIYLTQFRQLCNNS